MKCTLIIHASTKVGETKEAQEPALNQRFPLLYSGIPLIQTSLGHTDSVLIRKLFSGLFYIQSIHMQYKQWMSSFQGCGFREPA